MKSEAAAKRKFVILGIMNLIFLIFFVGCGGGTSKSLINQPVSSESNNPTPTITKISPNSTVGCSPAFTLTIYGTNFIAASMVNFGGAAPATTFVNSTQLTAAIPYASITSTGTSAVTVSNPAPGGGSSNSLTFSITTGATDPQSIAVDPAGKFAYVAGSGCSGGYVSMYTINATTGALASIGPPMPSGDEAAEFVSVEPSGKFAYVVTPGDIYDYGNDAYGAVSTYTINPTTGALTSTGAIYGTGVDFCCFNSVAADASGKFAYVVNENAGPAGNVSMYTINATTGALTSTGTIAAGTTPVTVVVDPSGKFAYVVNEDAGSAGNVSMYTINATTGALTSTGTIAAGTTPVSVAVDPAGKFAYVTNSGSNDVSMYTINGTTGALTSIGTIAAGTTPVFVAVDPASKFAYVANLAASGTDGSVSMYSINPTTGALTSIGTTATGLSPTSIAIHPSGKFAYVTNSGSNSVSMYSIDGATGTLSLIGTIGTSQAGG
jgi:YVTN family beta-propeller protein